MITSSSPSLPTRKMNIAGKPANDGADGTPIHAPIDVVTPHPPVDASSIAAIITTPTRKNAASRDDEEQTAAAVHSPVVTPRSQSQYGLKTSSCKRRRIAPALDDENGGDATPPATSNGSLTGGSARRLNYKDCDSDGASEDSDDDEDEEEDDEFDREMNQMRRDFILRRMKIVNCEDEDDRLMGTTSASAKLFEYVKDYDVVANAWRRNKPTNVKNDGGEDSEKAAVEGAKWVYRGSGYVRFLKCLVEGYNCGMVRMQLTKNGTLEILMCHELTQEEVVSMPSKKGKAYTWIAKDWAYDRNATRTFAIRFDDDMEAMSWRAQVERSKINNCRVRRGIDVPDIILGNDNAKVVDDVCSDFEKLSA